MHLDLNPHNAAALRLTERHDPRRSILVNGNAYRRELDRKPEPAVSFGQSLFAAFALLAFVGGGLLLLGGLS
jgi:hypothetical protein